MDEPARRARFRVPDAPPGVYLVLIFDGSEGGSHSTWDYFHVLGPPRPVGVFAGGLPPGWQLFTERLTPDFTEGRGRARGP